MKKINTIILLSIYIFIFSSSFLTKTYAKDITNTKTTSKIECPDSTYIKFKPDTFDHPVEVNCVIEQETNEINYLDITNLSPIYEVKVVDNITGKQLDFQRNEAEVGIPKENLSKIYDANKDDIAIFFYDEIVGDWISNNTISSSDKEIKAKFIHNGFFGVFSKKPHNQDDSYTKIAFYILAFGIGIGIIYVIIKK